MHSFVYIILCSSKNVVARPVGICYGLFMEQAKEHCFHRCEWGQTASPGGHGALDPILSNRFSVP